MKLVKHRGISDGQETGKLAGWWVKRNISFLSSIPRFQKEKMHVLCVQGLGKGRHPTFATLLSGSERKSTDRATQAGSVQGSTS